MLYTSRACEWDESENPEPSEGILLKKGLEMMGTSQQNPSGPWGRRCQQLPSLLLGTGPSSRL